MTSPTTTTTTTTSPLSIVQTASYIKSGSQMILTQTSNASDSTENQNTPLAKSFTFGTISPKEISEIVVVALNVPNTRAIANIRLGLIGTGGITFSSNIFAYTTSVELRDDITPESYFQGVNNDKSNASPYNINIKNRDNFNSEYVYLSVHLPIYQPIGKGLIKFCWWFDYC